MKFLFYCSHPAQYLAYRETIKRLSKKEENQLTVLIKTKDILESLIIKDGIDYINILPKERGTSRLAIILSLLKRILLLLPILLRVRPDLLIGTDAAIAQLGRLLNIDRITILEDDYAVIKNLANLTYPFTQTILCPEVCQVGSWKTKKVGYKGYMKLGYLHPTIFTADPGVLTKYSLSKDYILIRLSKLAAHHDIGISGIDENLLDTIIQMVNEKGYRTWISSEKTIAERYAPFQLKIDPSDMHHILANAVMLISDSQSMSVEAAVLGIPSIRYSGLVGKISVLNELETKYGLTFGIPLGDKERLYLTINELLSSNYLRDNFQLKRQKMLEDMLDISSFFVWFFENYPKSKKEVYNAKPTN